MAPLPQSFLLSHLANSLNSAEYLLSLPVILLLLFAAGVLLMDAVTPVEWRWMCSVTAFAGVLFSAGSVLKIQMIQGQLESSNRRLEWAFYHSVLVDHLTIYFYYLFLAIAALAIATLDTRSEHVRQGKSCSLILLSVAGMMYVVSGFDITIILGGLGLLSASGYLLRRLSWTGPRVQPSLKSALRWMFPWAATSAGLFLLYVTTGNSNLQLISQRLKTIPRDGSILQSHGLGLVGLVITTGGVSSLMAAMPFHRWMVNLSENISMTRAGFILVASQAAGFAMLLRIFLWGFYSLRTEYVPLLIVVAALSMIGGTMVALTQAGLARLLAYAAIVQAGFMMLGFIALASGTYSAPEFYEGFKGLLYSVATYAVAGMGCSALVAALEKSGTANERLPGMGCLEGLYYRDRSAAMIMSVLLFSLAGVPAFAGSYGKYFIVHSLLSGGHMVLARLGIICSLCGLYYYARVAQLMFTKPSQVGAVGMRLASRVALGIAAVLVVALGFHPRPLIYAAEWALRLT